MIRGIKEEIVRSGLTSLLEGQLDLEMSKGWSPEKAMAPHSSTLAWKIPWTEEPGRLQSLVLLRAGDD